MAKAPVEKTRRFTVYLQDSRAVVVEAQHVRTGETGTLAFGKNVVTVNMTGRSQVGEMVAAFSPGSWSHFVEAPENG